jgi:threonine synthase
VTPAEALPMRARIVVRCAACGHTLDDHTPHATCPSCGGLLEVLHAPPTARGRALQARFDDRLGVDAMRGPAPARSGVWRFHELVLPVDGTDAIVSHPEGNTPLLVREAVARFAGVAALHLKHEGHNPTGSFKDRGMTVAVTQARRIGATAVACASTGNTSASLAAYAAQAGIPALVLVPAGRVALGKLAQTIASGARTLLVRGDFDDCLRLVREAADRLGVYLANSVNPFRIEGQKTIVLELLQQLSWDAPDWIALPAGNLGNTAAFGRALREAHELGLIARVPRLAAIQASGAAPFARAFAEGFVQRHRVRAETVASAIRIGDPASWDRAVESIRYTKGLVIAVDDEDILRAKCVIDTSGVGCEPASAASVAGVRALIARGVIAPDERVVAVLTGHVLKDPESLLSQVTGDAADSRRPVEIDPELSAVERILHSVR